MEFISFTKSILEKIPKFINRVLVIDKYNIVVEVYKISLIPCFHFLKKHGTTLFNLVDITALHYPNSTLRYAMIYQLLSVNFNSRLTVKVFSNENVYPSLVFLYSSANWLEREVWDMFGLFFSSHPDLRRILTDYGFQGFPLRKDFPLTGFVELVYSEQEKRIIYVPLELTQEYRFFDFLSSWQI